MPICVNCTNKKKTYKGNEPSPKGKGYCGGCAKEGQIMKGLDGGMWIAMKRSNGAIYWKKYKQGGGSKRNIRRSRKRKTRKTVRRASKKIRKSARKIRRKTRSKVRKSARKIRRKTRSKMRGGSRKSVKKKSYFKKGHKLSVGHQKYCRCVLHVAAKQSQTCLKRKSWRKKVNGKMCYSPFAVCTKSTRRRGKVSCRENYNRKNIPMNERKIMKYV